MKKPSLIFLFLVLIFSLSASPYDMVLVGDPILDDLRYLSLESGRPFLSFPPPLSPHEIELFLNFLDTSLLSEPGREAYDRVRARLVPSARLNFFESDNFLMTININSTLEARVRTNDDISWYPQYPRVPPFITLPVRFFFSDSLMLYMEPNLTMKTKHYMDSTDPFGINFSPSYHHLDFFMPFRAFVAAGG